MIEIELRAFVRESNRIEGILRDPTAAEVEAHAAFLDEGPNIPSLVRLVSVLQPNAKLRDQPGLNVYVGDHVPPSGGPEIRDALVAILRCEGNAYSVHHAYETLHPFTDGNGRSGRALWLWMMNGRAPLNFLHHWYYQSLSNSGYRGKADTRPAALDRPGGEDRDRAIKAASRYFDAQTGDSAILQTLYDKEIEGAVDAILAAVKGL